jgi:hypothetical protein
LGTAGTDASAAIPLQLEDVVGDGWSNLVELLLSLVSWHDPQPASGGVSGTSVAPPSGKLLIVWDGLRSHRSGLVWDFVRQQHGRLWLEFLPAYAPELNPVEYLWSYWKQHELPNFCPQTFGQLSHHRARRSVACADGRLW